MAGRLKLAGRLVAVLLGVGACHSGDDTETAGPAPCTPEWYEVVERTVSVGDEQGHGPDLGSLEWRSAVEFKLGIRDDPTTPDANSEEWCAHIDRIIVEMRSSSTGEY